ncbi:MAG: extracellular solute-binding protein [Faecalicatena sp.]|uniref:ABC transporter substrate-binding protein n=1 Tax=Faecalicatena sp. TaxID=2005360 RepID=UPI0025874CBA|nr:extracellular solute-binding protein [Faecalicatena sp.]MCI6465406.1 extracellular solute-binding protein [Faecalicatena sp.]MDY5617238.1 extracellular solute-binding protein [Lachnospiraceae bacterium]
MKRKRMLSAILTSVLLCIITCTACSKKDDVYIAEDSEKSVITLFTQGMNVSDAIEEYCHNLKSRSGQNIVLYTDSADYYDDEGLSYRELLAKRLASGKADDIYLIPAEDVLDFSSKGYIYDLSDLECVNNLSNDALIQSTYDGKIFSIPLSYTCFGFVWNMDMLRKYGLELPNNLEEFWTVCEKLKQNGIVPYGANCDFGLGLPAMCAGLYDVYQSDDSDQLLTDLSDGTTPISTYMEDGFSLIEEMIAQGYMDPEQAINTLPFSEEETQYFADGKCAFISALYRAKTFEGYSFEIEMTPLPVLEEGKICVVGADQRLAVNPNSKQLDDALTILEYMGKTSTLDSIANELGKISSSKNVTAPDIPESEEIISYVAHGRQIPNQDFRLHFNVWNNVKELALKVCQGTNAQDAAAEYDERQKTEIATYGQ